jgi:hypothetical protein
MMASIAWKVVFYETEDGNCPVEEFLDGLDRKEKAKVLAAIDLLEEEGPSLRRPYADLLKDGIHELRVHVSKVRYRILYFFCDRTDIILTHGFKKKIGKVSEIEISRAKKCRADWIGRANANT